MASQFSSLSLVSWLGSSYLVATAATQPLIGKLADSYGRRLALFVSIFLFALGNVLCGASSFATIAGEGRGAPLLITGRVIAGAGGGAMNSIAAFIATDLVPLDRRAVWTGIADVLWAAGIGVGGVVGGAVHDWVGWPWAFFGFVPLTLLVFAGVYLTLRDDQSSHGDNCTRIDYPGAATLVSAIVCLTVGLNLAEQGDYIPSLSWALLATSAVLSVCFAAIESSSHVARNPFIPIRLLQNRTVAMVCASAVLVAASMHSLLYYVPFWIQVRGYSASQVGVQMLGELAGASAGSLTAGLVIKRRGGYGAVKPVALVVFAVAPLAFALSSLDTPVWATVLALAAMGAGFGSILTVMLIALLAATHQDVQTTCTSMLYTFRQTGAAAGLSVAGIILRSRFSQLARQIPDDGGGVPGQHGGLRNVVELCREGAGGVLHSLTDRRPQEWSRERNRPAVCVAYGEALHSVFVYSTALAIACLVCGLLVRNIQVSRLPR